ncbi:MAG: DUF4124 domain-containing protein [Gammaproteobacteria bacterium]|nr:DUF4124 domain-containing protein [Gammaproteobacteria bacterium]
MRAVSLLVIGVFSLAAGAGAGADQIYRWVDANGVVHYSDKPATQNAKPATLPPLQTFHGGVTEDPFANTSAPASAASTAGKVPAPVITQPSDQETNRDGLARIDIAVQVALAPGQGLIYTLDGTPQNKTPTQAMQYQLSGVDRGTHSVGVELTDADGKVIARAKPVTIYMKPPRIHHR